MAQDITLGLPPKSFPRSQTDFLP